MKTFYPFLILLLIANLGVAQQKIELPFFDDFSDDYENWTTYSVTGDEQWHLSGDDGIDGSKCARFYVTSNPPQANDDWLISPIFNTQSISNIAVTLKYSYDANGVSPEFYYATSYDGNPANTQWIQIDKTFWTNNWGWIDARIEIENPGETFVFAIRYDVSASDSYYFLMDNFKIESFEPVVYETVGSSEHFEFYTNIEGESNYWLEIKDALEEKYQKYCGHWNIPGLDDFMDNNKKTKVYYTEKENITYVGDEILDLKSGFFDRNTYSIFLSPLNSSEKLDYYGNLEGLATNTFAGYAVKHRILRDGWEDYLPPYFIEGFGLYEQGYRPVRDSVISFIQNHPDEMTHDNFLTFKNFSNSSEKDFLVAHYQFLLLFQGYKEIYWFHGNFASTEIHFFYYFYTAPDDIQIQNYDSSENFDIYCSSRDTMFIDSMKVWLERTRQFYVDSFQMEINVRYPLLVMYDEKTGMDLTGYEDFNGGSGSICISPINFWGSIDDGYDWLLYHEFGHIFNSLMYNKFPSGFYHEGMANFSGYKCAGIGEHLDDRWKIDYVFNYYQNKYHREPTLEEFITNPDAGETGLEYGIDCYFFGFEFIRFLQKNEGYLKIKEFFNKGLDFDVFHLTYDEIETGYINYLKYLRSIADHNEPHLITNTGLTLERGSSSIINTINLDATDQEVADNELYFKIRTKPSNGHIEKVGNPGISIVKFTLLDLKQDNIKYVNDNNTATSDFFIFTLTDETFFLDNYRFNINLTTPTAISGFDNANTNALLIYPNPTTSESIIYFQTKTSEKVNLAIFDIQGRKICTLLDEKRNAGKQTIPIKNTFPASGIYFCKLATSEGISVLKFVVK